MFVLLIEDDYDNFVLKEASNSYFSVMFSYIMAIIIICVIIDFIVTQVFAYYHQPLITY